VFAADWENGTHDMTEYALRYESPDNSSRNLKNLHLVALLIPANIAAKIVLLRRRNRPARISPEKSPFRKLAFLSE